VRTARGAGRLALLVLLVLRAGLRLLRVVPDDRDREPEPPLEDVLLLRDAGGEDVRVAMIRNVRDIPTRPTCHTPHTGSCRGGGRGGPVAWFEGLGGFRGVVRSSGIRWAELMLGSARICRNQCVSESVTLARQAIGSGRLPGPLVGPVG
jgi:hypothetical protein